MQGIIEKCTTTDRSYRPKATSLRLIQAFIKGLVINSTAVYLALEMNVSFISILQLVVVGLINISVVLL